MARAAKDVTTLVSAKPRKLPKLVIPKNYGLKMPGEITPVGWKIPKGISEQKWLVSGACLRGVERATPWCLGDWWVYGEGREWGDSEELAKRAGVKYGTARTYGSVARAFELSKRLDNLEFAHHFFVMAVPPNERQKWLKLAIRNGWSAQELKRQIANAEAVARTKRMDFDAETLGRHVILYADVPWQYEDDPPGNRSVEKEYPTMTFEEICAMPVKDVAHYDSVLFMWATSPKLAECLQVLEAWDFQYRTDMVWVKDKIGMGYYARQQHECLLIAKKGQLPPPAEDARPASVQEAPRLAHSAKPPKFYDLIDRMYPGVRKIELFGRNCAGREGWTFWGNQAEQIEAGNGQRRRGRTRQSRQ
jgi:N6-adenosine-specific RNA methylase IME4